MSFKVSFIDEVKKVFDADIVSVKAFIKQENHKDLKYLVVPKNNSKNYQDCLDIFGGKAKLEEDQGDAYFRELTREMGENARQMIGITNEDAIVRVFSKDCDGSPKKVVQIVRLFNAEVSFKQLTDAIELSQEHHGPPLIFSIKDSLKDHKLTPCLEHVLSELRVRRPGLLSSHTSK